MEFIYVPDYQTLGLTAARWVSREILRKPNLVLGLPTGSTPISMYQQLVRLFQERLISFKQVRTFNLDEYVGLAYNHPQSYASFMHKHLWDKVDLAPDAFNIPRGDASDLQAECLRYDHLIEENGGLDVQILGLGPNGHIGFNEPSHNLAVHTHVVDLTSETINANSRFFADETEVPRKAITMGVGSIMQADKVLLLVSGDAKRNILNRTLFGTITTEVPASILQLHSDLTVISDIKIKILGDLNRLD